MSIGGTRILPAQVSDSAMLAVAQTITVAELTRHLTALSAAADSVSNLSDTTQRAHAWRERAAAYLAEQWRRLGLVPTLPRQPARDVGILPDPSLWVPRDPEPGPWVQRYPAPGQRRVSYARTHLVLQTSGADGPASILNEAGSETSLSPRVELTFDTAAYFLPEAGPPLVRESVARTFIGLRLEHPGGEVMLGSRRVLLVAGPHTAATLHPRQSELEGAVVVYAPPAGLDTAARRAVVAELAAVSRGVIVLSAADSAVFAHELAAARQVPVTAVEHYLLERIAAQSAWSWVVAVRPVDGLSTVSPAFWTRFWSRAGLEPPELGTLTVPLIRELRGTEVGLFVALERQRPPTPTDPSVPAAAPDPVADGMSSAGAPLMLPYVLGFLEGADSALKQQVVVVTASLGDGADNGPELAGLAALAQAFTRPGARPRRSVLFVAAGGGPPAYSGSWMIASQLVGQAVMALSLEHRGARAASKTGAALIIDGSPDFTLPRHPALVAAKHPELGVQLVDTGTVFQPGTAALAFAGHFVPSVRLQLGALGPVVPVDVAVAVRELQFVWYLGAALADGLTPPSWTTAGRQRHFEAMGLPQP